VGLHCEPLLASILYGYIKQGQSNSMTIPATNDGTSASGISPISGYILNHLWFIILFMFFSDINMNIFCHHGITKLCHGIVNNI